ncbi:CsgG/HfaB family protein [Pelagicoccus sp. SDUM812003]|uniref:CsgG/HfaB family protein n=1 Tax=Pelagicoccus sp. SDUM812003 TaxID=3041267 RepID=UPI00280F4C24|nr:CsgG/HfaB family protein [Pelagicoccus sp. SDUM812003]MDQ8203941.1 CsgG/HfaB family protein [Pelagicoccus sp. SDUM812003]
MKKAFLPLVVACATAASSYADYLAYAEIKGDLIPLPESLDAIAENQPMDLIKVQYGDYEGPKTRIGVLPVENSSSTATHSISYGNGQTIKYSAADFNQVPVNGIDAMITDILNNTGRFRIVEREVLGNLLDEQDLGASGRVAQPSAAKVGKVLGANTFIKAVVTSYEPNYKGNSIGLGGLTGGALAGVRVGGSKSMVQMAFRLIDAETSEVTFSKQVTVVTSSKSLGFGGGAWGGSGAAGGAFSNFSKSPIGKAMIVAVNVGIYELIKQIGLEPTEGSVIQVAPNGQVVINLGENAVDNGQVLQAISKGEEFIDPDTGLSLGAMETALGNLKIVKVQEKFSFAQAVDFDASALSRGDKVVSAAPVGEIEYGEDWNLKGKRK